jgi:hypothetical protein
MEVFKNDRKLKVYWMYNDSLFGLLLKKGGWENSVIEEVGSMPLKKQLEWWNKNVQDTPVEPIGESPDTTWCFLCEDGKVIAQASVVKFHLDKEDRDKARKYSLAKLLKSLDLTKKERKEFWEAYLNRHWPSSRLTHAAVVGTTLSTQGS